MAFRLLTNSSAIRCKASAINTNDMVRIGDWITMPKYNADGDVTQITLTTVKIKNFDNANESLEMAIEEYKKMRPSSQGFLGILTNANNRRTKVDSKIVLIEDKIVENKKLEEAFKSVSDGNSLFDTNNFYF